MQPWIYDTNCCNFGTPPPSAATLGMIEGSTPFYSQLHFWRGMIEAPFYGQLHSDLFLSLPSQQPPRTLSWVEVFVWWGSHASRNICNIRNIKVEHETLYCHLHLRSLHSSLSIHLDLSNPKDTYNSHLHGSPRRTLHPKDPLIYSQVWVRRDSVSHPDANDNCWSECNLPDISDNKLCLSWFMQIKIVNPNAIFQNIQIQIQGVSVPFETPATCPLVCF